MYYKWLIVIFYSQSARLGCPFCVFSIFRFLYLQHIWLNLVEVNKNFAIHKNTLYGIFCKDIREYGQKVLELSGAGRVQDIEWNIWTAGVRHWKDTYLFRGGRSQEGRQDCHQCAKQRKLDQNLHGSSVRRLCGSRTFQRLHGAWRTGPGGPFRQPSAVYGKSPVQGYGFRVNAEIARSHWPEKRGTARIQRLFRYGLWAARPYICRGISRRSEAWGYLLSGQTVGWSLRDNVHFRLDRISEGRHALGPQLQCEYRDDSDTLSV